VLADGFSLDPEDAETEDSSLSAKLLEFLGHYRRYIQDFSHTAKLLHDLTAAPENAKQVSNSC